MKDELIGSAILSTKKIVRPAFYFKVGDEPSEWKGHTVLGWFPPRVPQYDSICVGCWDACIWNARVDAWTEGGDLDGHKRATHVMAQPPDPIE